MAETEIEHSTENADLERQARRQVRKLKEFYEHAGIYVLVNTLLVVINLLTSPSTFWAIWPILGWGILGLGTHAVDVFGFFGFGGKNWEERKVREYMLRHQRGLTADQVRGLLNDELDSRGTPVAQADWDKRVEHRLQNLEAIVTSRDWDLLESSETPALSSAADAAKAEDEPNPTEEASRIARRVR